MDDRLTRRGVMIGGAAAACAFCLGEADAAPPTSKPAGQPAASKPIDAGPVATFGKDGVYDALAKSNKVLIFRQGKKLYAASARCTHRNCGLRKEAKDIAVLRCPCHDSTFDLDGIPIDGPARESLPRYAIRVEGGRVTVDPSTIFGERQWDDAAASVDVKG